MDSKLTQLEHSKFEALSAHGSEGDKKVAFVLSMRRQMKGVRMLYHAHKLSEGEHEMVADGHARYFESRLQGRGEMTRERKEKVGRERET